MSFRFGPRIRAAAAMTGIDLSYRYPLRQLSNPANVARSSHEGTSGPLLTNFVGIALLAALVLVISLTSY